jgi:hypothetical protein
MRNLTAYLNQTNQWRGIFGKPALQYPKDRQTILEMLECDLSPENLTCDGELRGPALMKKAKLLRAALAECA